jgi:Ca2+/H+ antiporter
MRIEKVVLRVGGMSMLLGAIAFGVSLFTDAAVLRTLAMFLLAMGVVIAFLPLASLIAYTVWEKFRRGGK